MRHDGDDERDVEWSAARRPAVERSLDVLIVELRGPKGRDGRRRPGGCKAVRVEVHREEGSGVADHGEHASERACGGA